jgi:hypothetical protein
LFSENEQGARFFIQREIKILRVTADDLVARNERKSDFCVASGAEEAAMPKAATPKDETRQGIVLDDKAQEQPKDKKHARSSAQTENEDDELQPLREKSGF